MKPLKIASCQNLNSKKYLKDREKAKKNLFRVYEKIVNQFIDWFWKLAYELTNKFDFLYFETLFLKVMQRLWERKIGAWDFAEFVRILEYIAEKKNELVSYIDQCYLNLKTCSVCDYVLDDLPLDMRYWCCPSYATNHRRYVNASKSILRVGVLILSLGDASQPLVDVSV